MTSLHHNQQLFSDHYLAFILPKRNFDWQMLTDQAQLAMADMIAVFSKYIPSNNETQTTDRFIEPVLKALGHTFEIQASLATPEGTKQVDYVFYRDLNALEANRGKKLTDKLLLPKAIAVGEVKYWDSPLDRGKASILTDRNPSYRLFYRLLHSGLKWGILTNGRLWRLYHRNTAHKLNCYYEIDLPALLEYGSIHRFLYFYAFFSRSAFRSSFGVEAFLEENDEYTLSLNNTFE